MDQLHKPKDVKLSPETKQILETQMMETNLSIILPNNLKRLIRDTNEEPLNDEKQEIEESNDKAIFTSPFRVISNCLKLDGYIKET